MHWNQNRRKCELGDDALNREGDCMASWEELSGWVNPLVLRRYLEETGWELFSTKREDIAIYRYLKEDPFEQVTIPLDRTLRDYRQAMYLAVQDAAKHGGRPMEQLLLSLLNPSADILSVRLLEPDMLPGSVPFDEVVQFCQGVRKLLEASASDVLRLRGFPAAGSLKSAVQQFLRQCRFGQAAGLYCGVSLVCPFLKLEGDSWRQLSALDGAEECAESLARGVTRHLMEGIWQLKTADNAVSGAGIPIGATFLEAIADLCKLRAGAQADFQLQWFPAVRENIPAASSVCLTSGNIERIQNMNKPLLPNRGQQ